MPSSRFDEVRDYGFADQALALRKRARLTQRDLAALLGVSEKAIGAWETGLSYPKVERLQHLIALYRERGTFGAGREAEEATALWTTVRNKAARRLAPFDPIWFASLPGADGVPSVPLAPAAALPSSRHDWGEAPDVPALQGRAKELSTLVHWVTTERCRLVAVLGAGGIGKTTLVARLAQDLAFDFPVIYWRSLRNELPVQEWLAGAIAALSAAQTLPPDGLEARLGLALELLRARRALLVLDNLETVLAPEAPTVRYRPGYEGYGEVLRQLGESAHLGCLVVTSREKPLRDGGAAVRSLRLGGFGMEDGRALLAGRELIGDDAAWQALVTRYAGNPLALNVVGETIDAVFGGDIAAFLAQGTTVFGDIRQVLDEQVARLAALEQAALTWLAVEREPVTFAELVADLGPGVSRGAVVEAVEALQRRSLLEQGARGAFTVQPVVLEYATARLVEHVCEEVLAGKPALLVSHALLKAQAKDYVRHSQECQILQPLIERLHTRLGSAEAIERALLALLDSWRGRPVAEQGYGPGNVVNLLRLLRGDLRGLDLSRLVIRHAYLQEVEAQDTSLAGAHLAETVLDDIFSYPTAVALSADGALLAAGTSSGEIYLWQALDRTLLLALPEHAGGVWSVRLSGDGRLLVSASSDGTLKLWEIPGGRLLATVQGHTSGARRVSLSGDGRLLASVGFDGTIKLWAAPDGRPLATVQGHSGAARSVALNADGRLLASGSQDGAVELWETSGRQLLATVQGHIGAVPVVALNADGRLLATGSLDGTIKLWDVPEGRLLATLEGHTGGVLDLALSGDGHLLASSCQDGTVKLWKTPTGRLLATLQGHTGGIPGVALSGDGRLLASASFDGTIKLWEAESRRPLASLPGYTRAARRVALSGDGRLLANGHLDGTTRLWEAESGHLLATLQGHSGGVEDVALNADGRLLATGSLDGTVKLWGVPEGRLLATLEGHTGGIGSVTLSADGQLVASASLDGTIRLWEAGSGHLLATLEEHSGVRDVALSGDRRLLVSGSFDGTVKVWEAESGRLLATLRGHSGGVRNVALSADGRLIASGSYDGTVKLWAAPDGPLLATLPGHPGGVEDVALSADGQLVASASWDGRVKLWAANSGQLLATLEGHNGGVWGVALSGDGRLAASASYDGTAKLWETRSGACLRTLRGDRRYERMDISGLTGVTEAQRTVLLALGGVEREG